MLRQASAWNRFWTDFLEVWGVPKQTSKKLASEGFRVEISTPRQLLRSLGPLPETSARTPSKLPRSPSRSFSSREAGWKIVLFLRFCRLRSTLTSQGKLSFCKFQEVLNPTPLHPTPATCHKRKRKLRCSFWNAALQKLHCNIRLSAVRTSFVPKAALQQAKNCTATSKSLRCRKVALSCRFPTGFKPPRLGTHVSDLLKVF